MVLFGLLAVVVLNFLAGAEDFTNDRDGGPTQKKLPPQQEN
jgi:hypothetical protein